MIENTRRQRPVGQGSFHTAAVSVGRWHFRYGYDCGSENQRPLREQVEQYAAELEEKDQQRGRTSMELLFVSHLDQDHSNGLDHLLCKVRVHTVVLPYLTDWERLLLVAEATHRDSVTGDFLSLARDPVRWFGERGVRRVIFIVGDNEILEVPPPLPEGSPTDEEGEGVDFRTPAFAPGGQGSVERRILGHDVEVVKVPHDTPLVLRTPRLLNWFFLAFVHPEKEREDKFRAAFQNLLSGSAPVDQLMTDGNDRLVALLQDSGSRAELVLWS